MDCAGQDAPNDLGSPQFPVRAHGVVGYLLGEAMADYLSGLLIGSELGGPRSLCSAQSPLALVGGGEP